MAATIFSYISNEPLLNDNSRQGKFIKSGVLHLIHKDYPDFSEESFLSLDELGYYQKLYIHHLIKQESGELNILEQDVLKAISSNKILSENIEESIEQNFSFGQRIADKIADFGGSWTFIIAFFFVILAWIGLNVVVLSSTPFDPFPFILLNLILSCLAAIQAPVIMMSQNRKESKDRIRNEHDYKINLKAELEIRLLHDKLDHLMIHQNKKLLDILDQQSEYLGNISSRLK